MFCIDLTSVNDLNLLIPGLYPRACSYRPNTNFGRKSTTYCLSWHQLGVLVITSLAITVQEVHIRIQYVRAFLENSKRLAVFHVSSCEMVVFNPIVGEPLHPFTHTYTHTCFFRSCPRSSRGFSTYWIRFWSSPRYFVCILVINFVGKICILKTSLLGLCTFFILQCICLKRMSFSRFFTPMYN